jgi:hypothetical protein
MKLLTVLPILLVMALTASKADSKPARIYGNAYGLWSPTHPHLTKGQTKPNSPVLYVPLPPIVEPEIAEVPDVCPTLHSAPHLCQTL